jgi:DNA-binding transcriptional LysR family regulator
MDFKKLTTFQSAALNLSFSEAANQLGYVQSAVTNQIKALEEELGAQLFDRNGRGVKLTSAGKQLLHYTHKLISLRDEAKLSISSNDYEKPIQIGGHETIITYYLPKLLSDFSKNQPDMRFNILSTPVANLKRELSSDNLDVAFILEKPFTKTGLKVHTFQSEPVVIVCSPSHRLATKAFISPDELVNEHILLTEKGCCYRNQFERILIDIGAYAGQVSEFVSIEAIKQCVQLNLGIAALSLASVQKELANGELHKLKLNGVNLESNIHFVYNQNRVYSKCVDNFISYCSTYTF